MSSAYWRKFLIDAGIPLRAAEVYTAAFVDNRITESMVPDLSKSILLDLGITIIGDVIAILKHAIYVTEHNTAERIALKKAQKPDKNTKKSTDKTKTTEAPKKEKLDLAAKKVNPTSETKSTGEVKKAVPQKKVVDKKGEEDKTGKKLKILEKKVATVQTSNASATSDKPPKKVHIPESRRSVPVIAKKELRPPPPSEKKLIKTIPQKPASSENWFPAKPAPERKFAPRAHNSDSRMRRTEPQSNQYATKENQRDSRISQQAPKISQHDPRMTRNPKKMRADEMSRSVTARLGAKRHLSPSSESVDEEEESIYEEEREEEESGEEFHSSQEDSYGESEEDQLEPSSSPVRRVLGRQTHRPVAPHHSSVRHVVTPQSVAPRRSSNTVVTRGTSPVRIVSADTHQKSPVMVRRIPGNDFRSVQGEPVITRLVSADSSHPLTGVSCNVTAGMRTVQRCVSPDSTTPDPLPKHKQKTTIILSTKGKCSVRPVSPPADMMMEKKRKILPRDDGKTTLSRVVQRALDASHPKSAKHNTIRSLKGEKYNAFRSDHEAKESSTQNTFRSEEDNFDILTEKRVPVRRTARTRSLSGSRLGVHEKRSLSSRLGPARHATRASLPISAKVGGLAARVLGGNRVSARARRGGGGSAVARNNRLSRGARSEGIFKNETDDSSVFARLGR